MSNKVYFCNNGEFDPRAMLTFGVSVKEEGAIGYFGTGFKYSIAIILRLGGSIKVSSAGNEYVFSRRTEKVRGKEVDIVYCNDDNAGFTTHLGINWEPWMAYRELYSNCKDEGGDVLTGPSPVDTVIEVCCKEIYQAYLDTDKYFLSSSPWIKGETADIHAEPTGFVYFKGVAVAQLKSVFAYNLKSIDLTEDRSVKHDFQVRFAIQRVLQKLTDRSAIRKVLAPGDLYEQKMGFDADWEVSQEFVSEGMAMLKTSGGVSESARLFLGKVSDQLCDWPAFELSAVQVQMLSKAKTFLLGIGVTADDYEIRNVAGLGEGVMGRAKDGVIYLSDMPYMMGTKQLASTILEEWVHNKYGCKDFDRNMQSWLFDKVLSIGEELNGEPL